MEPRNQPSESRPSPCTAAMSSPGSADLAYQIAPQALVLLRCLFAQGLRRCRDQDRSEV